MENLYDKLKFSHIFEENLIDIGNKIDEMIFVKYIKPSIDSGKSILDINKESNIDLYKIGFILYLFHSKYYEKSVYNKLILENAKLLLKENYSIDKISNILHFSRIHLKKMLMLEDVSILENDDSLFTISNIDEKCKIVKNLLDQHNTITEIEMTTGFSRKVIYYYMKKMNYDYNSVIEYNNQKIWLDLKNILDKGYDYAYIQNVLGLNYKQIGILMRQNNYNYKCMPRIHMNSERRQSTNVQDVERLMNEGKTYREIGSILHISHQRVQQIAKKYGLTNLHEREYRISKLITPEIQEQIMELMKKGKKLKQISIELNISYGYLKQWFKDNNIDYVNLPKKYITDSMFENIKQLFEEGKTYTETAQILGISTTYIVKLCNKYNYRKRK